MLENVRAMSSSKILLDEKGWNDKTELYTVLEEQELLTEKARTLCVEALLTVHGLQARFTKHRRHNAQFMPQKQGRLPFLRIKNTIVNEDEIIKHLDKNGYNLSADLNGEDRLIHQGLLSLIENTLVPIELYTVWIMQDNVTETFEKYSSHYPRPLGEVLCREKLHDVKKYLRVTGWLDKTETEVVRELENLFLYFNERLSYSGQYQINNQLTEADVYIFGHLQTIYESKLRNNILLKTLEKYPKLTKFCLSFSQLHMGNETMLWELV